MRRLIAFFLLPALLSGNTLIVGVLGGWQRPDSPKRAVRKLALRVRERNLPNVSVETFANHNLAPALSCIKSWWAQARNETASLVIYGQSFGGAAVLRLARELQTVGIPIALTVQIDTVSARRSVVPPNVTAAVNFFQREGWPLKGEAVILAEDPKRTEILGNYEYRYRDKKIDESQESWGRRLAFGTHLKMEDDPELWNRVEQLIVSHIR